MSDNNKGQADQPTMVGRPVGARPMVPPEVANGAPGEPAKTVAAQAAHGAPADGATRVVTASAQPTVQATPADGATRVVDRAAAGTRVTGAQGFPAADGRTTVSAARQAARSQTYAPEPDTPYDQEEAPGLLGDLSVPQIVAGALAAVTSMLLSNQIGIAGSVIGVAVGSVVSTVASSLYKRALAKGADKLKEKILTPEEQAAADAAAAAGTADGATVDPDSVDARVAPASLRAKVHARDAKALQKRVGIGVIVVAVVSALAGVWFTAGFVSLATGGQGLGTKTSIISTAEDREEKALDQEGGNGDAVTPGTTDGTSGQDQNGQKPSTDTTTGTGTSGQGGATTGNGTTGGTDGTGTGTGGTGDGTGTGTGGTTGDGTTGGTDGTGTGTGGTGDGTGTGGTGTSTGSDGTGQQGGSGTARGTDGTGQTGDGAGTGSTSGN